MPPRATRSSAEAQQEADALAEQHRLQAAAAELARQQKAARSTKKRRAEGAGDEGETALSQTEITLAPASQQPAAPADSAALQRQVAELALLVKQQAQRADEQQQQHARQQQSLIEQLRASPANLPPDSAQPSPQLSPRQEPSRDRTPAAAAAAAPARRKEPRLSDLAEYNGASGDKLDAWLAELRRCARYYQLSGADAVEFAVARLRDTADTWWAALDTSAQTAICSVDALAAALRARFQPVTTARVAREKLHGLQQGTRHIDDYIADFSKLRAQVADMAEPDARAQFVRGLRPELANKLEEVDWESMQLPALIAKAARIGARTAAARAPQGRINQMDVDDGDSAPSLDDRIAKAVLNAMQSAQGGNGGSMGAKTQTQRSYQQERERGGAVRGGSRGGGRGGRLGSRGMQLPSVPGVSEEAVRERFHAKQCLRCGREGHTSHACPNAISASGN
jgi:hypothetical protein